MSTSTWEQLSPSSSLSRAACSPVPDAHGVAPLISACRHLLQPNGIIVGKNVARAILPRFPDLISTLPFEELSRAALGSVDGRSQITHSQIADFIREAGRALHRMQIGRGHRVAVVLPNGPELALSILAVSSWASCVPLNAFGATNELEADLKNAAADILVGLDPHRTSASQEIKELAYRLQIPFCGLVPDSAYAGLFELIPPLHIPTNLSSPRRRRMNCEADRSAGDSANGALWTENSPEDRRFLPNQHDDEVLVLYTSGTTGSKKLVPHVLADILVATACICVSWKLSPEDTNCNLMPLFHVGGIIRQVFSPILSGGCVICCPSFDPTIFWQLMNKQAFTWYYAAPTMHQIILQTGRSEGHIEYRPRLRMIANAAGGLLPSLARELRQVFGANVLPSYGMTECMPITSPPATYQLEKPGTSGVAVGPEIAILDLDTMQPLQPGKEGPICVRSAPCFRGYGVLYGGDNYDKPETFLPGGWFNTGDLGFMDEDSYLYITGRAKEVINRGGEIISPIEVEEALSPHPDIVACVAFSTKHSVLQEVVGLLLVPALGRPRVDLPRLHQYLGQGRLTANKWPQCLVYMDGLPKSHTNKLLRVKLGQRLGLPEINDGMYPIERTFQAKCPPMGTPVTVAIPCESVALNHYHVQELLRKELITHPNQDLVVAPHPNKIGALVAHVYNINRLEVVQVANEKIDAYAVPSHVCELNGAFTSLQDLGPPQQSDAVGSILQEDRSKGLGPTDPLVIQLQELVQVLLDLDCLPAPDSNFFNLGGSSMLASQLASRIRKVHNVPFGGAEVFHHASCNQIAHVIRERRGELAAGGDGNSRSEADPASVAASSLYSKTLDLSKTPFDPSRQDCHSGFWISVIQLIPLLLIYPLWQLTRLFCFFQCLLWVLHIVPGEKNLYKFVFTLVSFHLLWLTFTPLLFVLLKHVIVGQYRTGRYPIWSEYYIRWWFVDVLRKLIGRGIWGSNDALLNCYYRLLGAKIGKNARISPLADLAEYDLVSIGEQAAVEFCTVRGFGVDNGSMILGPVIVGNHASVGARSVVAPYTMIPDRSHLGPGTSSYEINASMESGADLQHLAYNRQALPEPGWLSKMFIVAPITFFVDTLSHLPALSVLVWMVSMPWHHNEPFETAGDLMEWLCDFRRIPFFVGIRIARALLAPIVYMAGSILVKWLLIGKFQPGPRDTTSEWQLTRHFLAATLFSRENMQECTELLGRHYELVSVLYRLLGAKVGKRVFWPGHQPVFSGEFDLLEIADDVVFGSRASIFCTTVDSCEKVILAAGSNVSDNTIVLPGSIVGKNAVLGSNSVCPAGRYLPESSVWFGSRRGEAVMLEKGVEDSTNPVLAVNVDPKALQMNGDESTLRPFGKALYYRQASYFVFPLPLIIALTIMTRIVVAVIHVLPLLGAVHLAAGYFYGWSIKDRDYSAIGVSSSTMYMVLIHFYLIMHFLHVCLWSFIEYISKWTLIGQRAEGRYNYDVSNYCQYWELYQIIAATIRFNGRRNFLDFITGTQYMTAFFRSLGCKIGKDCCLYPTGGDPYMPEPDLVHIGDRCVIDCAAVICHLNTRGNFELAKITMDNHVTLRTRSRIQQAVYMESGAMLLEKSLAMTGEVIEADSIWVGAPASRLMSYDTTSMGSGATSYQGSSTGAFV